MASLLAAVTYLVSCLPVGESGLTLCQGVILKDTALLRQKKASPVCRGKALSLLGRKKCLNYVLCSSGRHWRALIQLQDCAHLLGFGEM